MISIKQKGKRLKHIYLCCVNIYYYYIYFLSKVGQANTDAREAEKQVSKGLEDLKVIMDELQNLPTLDDEALDRLSKLFFFLNFLTNVTSKLLIHFVF